MVHYFFTIFRYSLVFVETSAPFGNAGVPFAVTNGMRMSPPTVITTAPKIASLLFLFIAICRVEIKFLTNLFPSLLSMYKRFTNKLFTNCSLSAQLRTRRWTIGTKRYSSHSCSLHLLLILWFCSDRKMIKSFVCFFFEAAKETFRLWLHFQIVGVVLVSEHFSDDKTKSPLLLKVYQVRPSIQNIGISFLYQTQLRKEWSFGELLSLRENKYPDKEHKERPQHLHTFHANSCNFLHH